MLAASACVAPASIYLDYLEMNPSLMTFGLLAGGSFLVLALAVWLLNLWWPSELVVVVVGLVWVVLTTFGLVVDFDGSAELGVVASSAAIGVIAVVARMFRRQLVAWFLVASVMSIMATVIQLVLAISRPLTEYELPTTQALRAPTGSFYLIVVDGYGPLDEEAASFRDDLEDQGFAVIDGAVSNYSATYSSMSNMFSLDHRFRHGSAPIPEIFNVIQGVSRMRAIFESAGHKYVQFESDWSGTRCGSSVSNCVENGWVDDYVWEFAQSSFLGPLIKRTIPNPHVSQGLKTLDALESHARTSDSGSDFAFAHILLPHPPLQLQADCTVRIDERFLDQFYLFDDSTSHAERLGAYRQQRACLNARLLALISVLPLEASVVITSDHGPDIRGQLQKAPATWDELDIVERFRIFHAARLPAGCDFGSARDLVNLVRVEVSCVTGASFPPIDPYFEVSPFVWSEDDARVLEGAEADLLMGHGPVG